MKKQTHLHFGWSEGEDIFSNSSFLAELFLSLYIIKWKCDLQSEGSDNDSDDNGFYSDGEEPASKKRHSSGLCVAFKFPTKRGPAPKRNTAKKGNKEAPPPAPPISRKPAGGNRKRREPEQSKESTLYDCIRAESQSKPSDNVTNVESLLTDEEMQILSKRAKNIQENKAMVSFHFVLKYVYNIYIF